MSREKATLQRDLVKNQSLKIGSKCNLIKKKDELFTIMDIDKTDNGWFIKIINADETRKVTYGSEAFFEFYELKKDKESNDD